MKQIFIMHRLLYQMAVLKTAMIQRRKVVDLNKSITSSVANA